MAAIAFFSQVYPALNRTAGAELPEYVIPATLYPTLSSPLSPFAWFANPALAAEVRLFSFGGTVAFVGNDLVALGALVVPTSIGSFYGRYEYDKLPLGRGELKGGEIGFAKHFGSELMIGTGLSYTYGESGTLSDFGIGWDVGAVLKTKTGIGFATNLRYGVALEQIGKWIGYGLTNGDGVPSWRMKASVSGESPINDMFTLVSGISVRYYPLSLTHMSLSLDTELSIYTNWYVGGGFIVNEPLLSFWHLSAGWGFSNPANSILLRYDLSPRITAASNVELINRFTFSLALGEDDKNPPAVRFDGTVPGYISPNNDGRMDSLLIYPEVKDASPVIGWQLIIRNEAGDVVRTFEQKEDRLTSFDYEKFMAMLLSERPSVAMPRALDWDGTDTNGIKLPDGRYTYILRAKDEKGLVGSSVTNSIVLDTVPPVAAVRGPAPDIVFSQKGSTVITFSNRVSDSGPLVMKARVFDNLGGVVKELSWQDSEKIVTLDARDLPSGVYSYWMKALDAASNETRNTPVTFEVNHGDYVFSVAADRKGFSPKVRSAAFKTKSMIAEPVLSSVFSIRNEKKEDVFTQSFSNIPPAAEWTGKRATAAPEVMLSSSGKAVTLDAERAIPDGNYIYSFSASLGNGLTIATLPAAIIVDTTPPMAAMTLKSTRFSPDGDGEEDTLGITVEATDSNEIASWELSIVEAQGGARAPFKRWQGSGAVNNTIAWEGRSDSGVLVESANDYFISLAVTDEYGNATRIDEVKVTTDILVVKHKRGFKIKVSNIEFDFGKDTLKDSAKPILVRLAEILKKYGRYRVSVEGHTDNIGSDTVNAKLSERRAARVHDELIRRGIDTKRLSLRGLGAADPLYDNKDDWGRARNRRVEFILEKAE
ncbi:MAG: OmpA family protein [Spirochaetes bacterium]|nr:OmpA family protein [Spirochaetota bacterium]